MPVSRLKALEKAPESSYPAIRAEQGIQGNGNIPLKPVPGMQI